MDCEFRALENPRKWRFTWETQAHIPILRLFLFNPNIKPVSQCQNLKVSLNFEDFMLQVGWIEGINDGILNLSLTVPVPRVLVDLDSSVDFRATEDHIEVKLALLLPVDHPIVTSLISAQDFPDEGFVNESGLLDRLQPLSVDSDIKNLSSCGGVYFYCKNCSTQLTVRPLRFFVEMPSVNWREVADNWFGACCCSFGGASEKMVTKYANSYDCAEGTCLVDAASVVVCESDLAGLPFHKLKHGSEPDLIGEVDRAEALTDSCSIDCQSDQTSDINERLFCMSLVNKNCSANIEGGHAEKKKDSSALLGTSPTMSDGYVTSADELSAKNLGCYEHEGCSHNASVICSKFEAQESREHIGHLVNQMPLLNGYLGSGFMVRSSNISKDVKWIEFLCTQCSSLLGAYPCASNNDVPLDGGIRLFKCYISTGLPVGGSGDVFRKHTLQGMLVNQLLESAMDELSFRTLVRDLSSKLPVLCIVLLNPDAWCCTGHCLEMEGTVGPVSKIYLHPVVKVLFSECSDPSEVQTRMMEEWATKNQTDEVHMIAHQIKELVKFLKSAQDRFPPSCSSLQGLCLACLDR
ncbi:PREDICTED: uncharacterized protein LOC104595621 [Nelumbo nucifera]|uniref:Ubiquitin-conjugating enzyme E2C-binding protein n=2 Tax=Nelumbo nucifera TaxID=4432 RepID=A0A822ZGL9_NELNU|nr:PREDICTED: uncharacterized protein LOC104595621 [Nelumbo nucifera]DAD40798.1 TPA_asm: hypothetical protein HUJ06_015121 [Nelumbo nucifera]